MTTKATTKAIALDLARRGFAVFPIKPKDKIPATANGFKNASTDPAVVEKMFAKRADYNVGIATGPVSGIWVLDIDGEEGRQVFFSKVMRGQEIPWSAKVHTPGGGLHMYFRCNGKPIKNRTKIGGMPIDVRGEGGYVVTHGSIHPNGLRYVFDDANSESDPDALGSCLYEPGEYLDEMMPLPEAPAWLIDFVTGDGKKPDQNDQVADQAPAMPAALAFTVGSGAVEDLETAPGAGEGQRHDTACRLIGSAIGRGLDLCNVTQQAVEWSRRCTPPIPEDEVLKIVSDLSQRQGGKIEAVVREQVEETPIPDQAPWPILDEDAYHGLAGKIVKAVEPESEADPVAILIQLLVSAGSLVGRSARYSVEGTFHYANLFAVLVGATARGRKGTSEGRVREVLRFVDEKWTLGNIKTGLVSGEGLIWSVRDPIYKTEAIKDKGRVVGTEQVLADPGIDDKRLLVVESEFASVLRVCKRETNTLSPTLRSAWDTGVLRTMAKNMPATATAAHVSIIGHITVEELRRALAEVDGFNGFANRFLWIAVKRSKLLPDGGQDLDLSRFAQRLAEAVVEGRGIERMKRDQGAAALWRKIYTELADDDSTGLVAAVTSRAEAQVLRLSMIYALLDCSNTIKPEHLRAALALWRYCRQSATLIFGNAGGDPLSEKVLDAIRQQPGIGRWELHSTICKHKPAAVLVEVLTRLRDAGKIEAKFATTTGRSAETWFPSLREKREEREISDRLESDQGLTSHSSLTSGDDNGIEEVSI